MAILSNIFRRPARREVKRPNIPDFYVPRDSKVDVVSAEMGMKVSAVYSAVDILSNTVAKLSCHFKVEKDGVFRDADKSDLYWLLMVQPNPRMTAHDFWKSVVSQIKLLGNAYVLPSFNAEGYCTQLTLIAPNSCTYDKVNDKYIVTDTYNRINGTFESSKMLHFKNNSLDGGLTGVSTIAYAATCLSIQATGDAETLSRFAKGGRVKAIFCNDSSLKGFGEYTDEALEQGAKDIQRDLDSGRDIIAVPGQGELRPLSMSSVELQYLESRKFGIREICRFFRVPPTKLYDEGGNTYGSAEQANLEFLADSIDPILSMIEVELKRKLIDPRDWATMKFEFDREKLILTDVTTKANYEEKMLAAGIVTINDLRRKHDLAPVEGGDEILISCNVAALNSEKIKGTK